MRCRLVGVSAVNKHRNRAKIPASTARTRAGRRGIECRADIRTQAVQRAVPHARSTSMPSLVCLPPLRVRCMFSFPVRRSCRCMEGFLNRGWGIILPGCGGTSTFFREATRAARKAALHWPRAGGGRELGQRDRDSENAGLKATNPFNSCIMNINIYQVRFVYPPTYY